MTSFYLFIRFLVLFQQLTFSPRAVSADPKVDQCLSLGLISQIANCLDPFIVSHPSISLRNTCTTDIRGTGKHLDNRRSVCSCPAFFTGTRGLLGCCSLRSQRYREWCSMHLSSIPIHPPRISTEFRYAPSDRRFMCLGGKHSLQWNSVCQRPSSYCLAKPLDELTARPHLGCAPEGRWSGTSPSCGRLRAYRCKELPYVHSTSCSVRQAGMRKAVNRHTCRPWLGDRCRPS